jgi:uncharacterized protein YndB with AHSA1/START domain
VNKSWIERKIFIEASPEIIYSYFIQAEKLSQWMGAAFGASEEDRHGGNI